MNSPLMPDTTDNVLLFNRYQLMQTSENISLDIPLSGLGQALLTAYGQGASHGRVYRAITGGAVQATRTNTGWVMPRAELPKLAAHLRIPTNAA